MSYQAVCYTAHISLLGLNGMLFKIIVVVAFLVIIWTLATACYNLTSKNRDPNRLYKSLAWRIGLSFALFLFILLGAHMKWFKPNNPFPPDKHNISKQ